MSEPSFLEVVGEVHNILESVGTIPGVLSLTYDDVNGYFLVGFHFMIFILRPSQEEEHGKSQPVQY